MTAVRYAVLESNTENTITVWTAAARLVTVGPELREDNSLYDILTSKFHRKFYSDDLDKASCLQNGPQDTFWFHHLLAG